MMLQLKQSMSSLAWARWWAAPWLYAHEGWIAVDKQQALNELCQARRVLKGTIFAVTPCLPPAPQPTLLQLALAPADQLELVLALINSTCRPAHTSEIDESHLLWCRRLSKALPSDMLPPEDDPLHLLRVWVTPPIWQRIRLRFPPQRVLNLEQRGLLADAPHSRLDTLWQAVVWRATARNSNTTDPYPKEPGD